MLKERIKKVNGKLALQEALNQMCIDLSKLGPVPNHTLYKDVYDRYFGITSRLPVPTDDAMYDYAIKFFNIIVRFQDSGVWNADLLSDKKTASVLGEHIRNSGYGAWVRAERGQPVTEDNVFLGNVFGLWTNSIRTFKEQKNDSWLQWAIQTYQLGNFLNSHVEEMKKLITAILLNEQKAKLGVVDSVIASCVRFKRK